MKKMWKNIVEPERSHMKILRMCFAFWIPITTNTYSEYVILILLKYNQLIAPICDTKILFTH